MQNDEVIWQVINQGFCTYKVKTDTKTFCRNKYNVSGLCLRSSCPLANSRYATVIEDKGRCYLYMKTVERAHMPRNLWEKIRLPADYFKALEKIDSELQYWPKFLRHKSKQRLTKIHQYLTRIRKFSSRTRPKLVGRKKKVERRERSKEQRAEKAALLEKTIEKELLEKLKSGTYGDIYNYNSAAFEHALEEEELSEEESEREFVEAEDEISDVEDLYEYDLADEEDMEEATNEIGEGGHGEEELPEESSEEQSESEEEDVKRPPKKKRKKKGKRTPHVEIEYEMEPNQMEQLEF